jgi:hypothetical protein
MANENQNNDVIDIGSGSKKFEQDYQTQSDHPWLGRRQRGEANASSKS